MAGSTVEEAGLGLGFWLPPEFLTDDDFLTDKQNFGKNFKANSESEFCFPSEFPYDSPTLKVTSPSPLSKPSWTGWGNGDGSPNGVLSPSGDQYDAVGDLIYRVAGQVAKLKMNGCDGPFVRAQAERKDPFAPPGSHCHFQLDAQTFSHKQQSDNSGMWNYSPHQKRAVLWGGGATAAAATRACAGTGVFLPRRYGGGGEANSADARKKTGCSPGLVPVTSSPNAHTKKPDSVNILARPRPLPQSNRSSAPDYDWLMARRHKAFLQQQRSVITALMDEPRAMRCDPHLPHEWTY